MEATRDPNVSNNNTGIIISIIQVIILVIIYYSSSIENTASVICYCTFTIVMLYYYAYRYYSRSKLIIYRYSILFKYYISMNKTNRIHFRSRDENHSCRLSLLFLPRTCANDSLSVAL